MPKNIVPGIELVLRNYCVDVLEDMVKQGYLLQTERMHYQEIHLFMNPIRGNLSDVQGISGAQDAFQDISMDKTIIKDQLNQPLLVTHALGRLGREKGRQCFTVKVMGRRAEHGQI